MIILISLSTQKLQTNIYSPYLDWTYTYGPPMAVAPINMVRRVVSYAVTAIPREKIILGMPNYGYDWTLPFVKGESKAMSMGNQAALALAFRYNADLQFDEAAQAPWFEYQAADGTNHIVWFEDIRSVQASLALADEFSLPGVGYWTVMYPFNQSWAYMASRYNIEKVVP